MDAHDEECGRLVSIRICEARIGFQSFGQTGLQVRCESQVRHPGDLRSPNLEVPLTALRETCRTAACDLLARGGTLTRMANLFRLTRLGSKWGGQLTGGRSSNIRSKLSRDLMREGGRGPKAYILRKTSRVGVPGLPQRTTPRPSRAPVPLRAGPLGASAMPAQLVALPSKRSPGPEACPTSRHPKTIVGLMPPYHPRSLGNGVEHFRISLCGAGSAGCDMKRVTYRGMRARLPHKQAELR
jgi:hypothetical protein